MSLKKKEEEEKRKNKKRDNSLLLVCYTLLLELFNLSIIEEVANGI